MKVYVDTNVLVDFVCNRQGFVEEAKKLFAHGYMEEYELMTSALSIVNAVYIGHKYKHNDIEECLIKVASFVDVVDLRGQVVVDMLSSDWKDYEDATQNASAIWAEADCIVTRNKKDFKDSSVPVYTVTEFFGVFCIK